MVGRDNVDPPFGGLTASILFESLILAQDKRWRRALGMQVECTEKSQDFLVNGGRVSNSKESAPK